MLFTYAADIVYLWRLFQSPEFEIFVGLESWIWDFLREQFSLRKPVYERPYV